MASSVVSGASPVSGYDFHTDSTGDPDENLWTLLQPGSSVSSNGGFSFSPASLTGSMASYLMINNRSNGHQAPLSGTLSPLNLDFDQQPSSIPADFGPLGDDYSVPSGETSTQFIPDGQSYLQHSGEDIFGNDPFNTFNQDLGDNGEFLFTDLNGLPVGTTDLSSVVGSMGPFDLIEQQPLSQATFDIPEPFQSAADVPPWNPENLHTSTQSPAGNSPIFVMEGPGLVSPKPATYQSPSVGTPPTASPQSPISVTPASSSSSINSKKKPEATSQPIPIRRTRGSARVQKKKAPDSAPRSAVGSAGSNSSSSSSGQFLIVTPDSVHAHAGRPNPYECFEAARPSQKGRKGPLQDETKENALEVRRRGACFCCHARKVRCDKERPCRNCTKLMVHVPQVICWQFPDFLPVLFPTFIRAHFRKEEMSRFMADNIAGFKVDGVEKPCTVELFSGAQWAATFRIEAKFFTARTENVLRHWHMQVGRNQVDLQAQRAPPIALEPDRGGAGALSSQRRDEIRKKAREYIASIIQEPKYAEQVTDSLRHTDLPRKILRIVQTYAKQSPDQVIVKKALSIYAMHYVMTRHLCLTRESLDSLRGSRLVAQDHAWVTPRVLNRQIKSVVDEMLMREVQLLFDAFGKGLKPKSRREWAPCLAAFLVLCLFMEAVETASDTFVMSQNEIDLRGRRPGGPQWRRRQVLEQNRALENLPFKQFAHQFHQIYATHSRDANAKSFNPLVDEASLQLADLDTGAIQMVLQLRQLIMDQNSWDELDYLCIDPILPNQEEHPFPRDISFNYTGRLVAKFLLSFTNEKYIFGAF